MDKLNGKSQENKKPIDPKVQNNTQPTSDKTRKPVDTGVLMFQFNDNEPIKIQDVYDNANVSIKLDHPIKVVKGVSKANEDESVMKFTDGENTFKLILKRKQ